MIGDDDRQGKRSLLLLKTGTPWYAVIDSTNWVPQELAGKLSEAAGGEALYVCVVDLTYSILQIVEGEPVVDRRVPPATGDGLMPHYVDAEREAWEYMAELGIPSNYRMLEVKDVDMKPRPEGELADAVVCERDVPGGAIGYYMLRHQVGAPRSLSVGMPSTYTVGIGSEMVMDMFMIEGRVNQERADHLLTTIDSIGRRKVRMPGQTYSVAIVSIPPGTADAEAAVQFIKQRYEALAKSQAWSFRL